MGGVIGGEIAKRNKGGERSLGLTHLSSYCGSFPFLFLFEEVIACCAERRKKEKRQKDFWHR